MAILTATTLQGNLFVDGVINDSSNSPGTVGQQLVTDGLNNNWTTRQTGATIRALRASGLGNQTITTTLSAIDTDQPDLVTQNNPAPPPVGPDDFGNLLGGAWRVNIGGLYRVSYNFCVLNNGGSSTELGAIEIQFFVDNVEYNPTVTRSTYTVSSERQNGTDYNVNIENRISKTFVVNIPDGVNIVCLARRIGQTVGGNPRISLDRSNMSVFGVF